VDDRLDAALAQRARQRLAVEQIALDEGGARRHCIAVAANEIVVDDDAVAVLEQPPATTLPM
jgi:hypothetical protein